MPIAWDAEFRPDPLSFQHLPGRGSLSLAEVMQIFWIKFSIAGSSERVWVRNAACCPYLMPSSSNEANSGTADVLHKKRGGTNCLPFRKNFLLEFPRLQQLPVQKLGITYARNRSQTRRRAPPRPPGPPPPPALPPCSPRSAAATAPECAGRGAGGCKALLR